MSEKKVMKIIDEMANYIDDIRSSFLSRDKISISRDELFSFIDELRQILPVEFEESNRVIRTKKEIIANAQAKADQIEAETNEKIRTMVLEDEITIAAQEEAESILNDADRRADEIIRDAEDVATQIKVGALSYAEEMLAAIEKAVAHMLETSRSSSDKLLETLGTNLNIIQNNRNELTAQIFDSNDDGDDFDEELEEEAQTSSSETEFTVKVEEGDFAEEDDYDDEMEDDEIEIGKRRKRK